MVEAGTDRPAACSKSHPVKQGRRMHYSALRRGSFGAHAFPSAGHQKLYISEACRHMMRADQENPCPSAARS
jgi:hypothetical protein